MLFLFLYQQIQPQYPKMKQAHPTISINFRINTTQIVTSDFEHFTSRNKQNLKQIHLILWLEAGVDNTQIDNTCIKESLL